MLDGQEKTLEVSASQQRSSPAKQRTLDTYMKRCSNLDDSEHQPKLKYPRHWMTCNAEWKCIYTCTCVVCRMQWCCYHIAGCFPSPLCASGIISQLVHVSTHTRTTLELKQSNCRLLHWYRLVNGCVMIFICIAATAGNRCFFTSSWKRWCINCSMWKQSNRPWTVHQELLK